MKPKNEISARRFLMITLIGVLIGASVIVVFNLSIDIYGLFGINDRKSIPVYHNERISKYLLSYEYIPENFNTILIGPSLSDNLDVTYFNNDTSKFKVYNASIMGANISELKPIVFNAVNGGVKNVIICLSPYLTMNSGSKEVAFDQKLYYGALGSVNLYETYAVGLIRQWELMPNKFPKDQINPYGVNDYATFFKQENIQKKIDDEVKIHQGEEIVVDTIAVNELKEIIETLNKENVNYIGYFHPLPIEIYDSNKTHYAEYKEMISALFDNKARLIDFNSPEFKSFTSDYSNYIDHGHLSAKGQAVIVEALYDKMEKLFVNK